MEPDMDHFIKIDIDDVRKAGSVAKAIIAASKDADWASGYVDGYYPNTKWADDFATKALEGGATAYIDEDNGRVVRSIHPDDALPSDEILVDAGGCEYVKGEWSDESEVCLVCPSADDALEYPEAFADMARTLVDHHHVCSDVAAWKKLVGSIIVANEAIEDVTEGLAEIETE